MRDLLPLRTRKPTQAERFVYVLAAAPPGY